MGWDVILILKELYNPSVERLRLDLIESMIMFTFRCYAMVKIQR